MSFGLSTWRQSTERETPERLALVQAAPEDDDSPLQAQILQLIGEGKRVLALGNASSGLLQELHEQGCDVVNVRSAELDVLPDDNCRVVVTEMDKPDLVRELSEETFEVILAMNILEYLRDPLAVLKGLRKHLHQEGYVVAVMPNVAHGNIRLALLEGRFPFAEDHLPEHAPLRFFTYDSMVALFESAGYAIGAVERLEQEISVSGDMPTDVLEAVTQAPEAHTSQFVTVAYALSGNGPSWLQGCLRQLVDQYNDALRELAGLRQNLQAADSHLRVLLGQQEASLAREKELRARALEVHEQLAQRDEEYRNATRGLEEAAGREKELQQTTQRLTHRLEEAAGREKELQAKLQEATQRLAHRDLEFSQHLTWCNQQYAELLADRNALQARLGRLRNSPLGWAFRAVRKLKRLACGQR
jgi:hypothetical protein